MKLIFSHKNYTRRNALYVETLAATFISENKAVLTRAPRPTQRVARGATPILKPEQGVDHAH